MVAGGHVDERGSIEREEGLHQSRGRSFTPKTRVAQRLELVYLDLAARELRPQPALPARSAALAVGKRESALMCHTASIRSSAGPLPEAGGTHRRASHRSSPPEAFYML